jgi:hypothetical protein
LSIYLFEPASLASHNGRRTSLPEIDIVLQIILDVRGARQKGELFPYSHSIVPGGFEVTSQLRSQPGKPHR